MRLRQARRGFGGGHGGTPRMNEDGSAVLALAYRQAPVRRI